MTQFSFGVLLARIPLFLFQAVQAALLPGLSRLAARGELVEFRAGLARLAYLVIAVGVIERLVLRFAPQDLLETMGFAQ